MASKTVPCLLRRLLRPFDLRDAARAHGASVAGRRWCSGGSKPESHQDNNSHKRSDFSPAAGSTHDWIGPPDRLSNLRPIIYHVPDNETELEKRLRNLRQETENWNRHFWTEQNVTFSKEKEGFIVSQLKVKGLTERDEHGRRRSLSSEEMSVFYKSFLDENRTRHADYNKEWYRRNFTITFLMGRVALHHMRNTIVRRRKKKKSPTG